MRSLRLLGWLQQPHKVTDGKVTKNHKCKNSHFLKNQLFSFLPYLGSYLAYRGVQYLKLIVLRFYFDPLHSFLELGWLFEEIRCGESVRFFFSPDFIQQAFNGNYGLGVVN